MENESLNVNAGDLEARVQSVSEESKESKEKESKKARVEITAEDRKKFSNTNSQYMKELTKYNEIKDIGQMLMGLCAEKSQSTVKVMYERFGMEIDD